MRQLTSQGQQLINDLAQRYNVSSDAVLALLQALVNGGGTMAQFNHPDLGGSGQWMQGGMTMVGDMFNYSLKATVDGLCSELTTLLANQPFVATPSSNQWQQQGGSGGGQQQGGWAGSGQQQQQGSGPGGAVSLFVPESSSSSGNWWPSDLGNPAATGAQNNVRYAYFPYPRRLAVNINGKVTVYNTLDHQISGFSQQQSGSGSVTFTSQYGVVSLIDLPLIGDTAAPSATPAPSMPVSEPQVSNEPTLTLQQPPPDGSSSQAQESDIFAKLEKLAALKQQGIISEEEFTAKKSELLARL